MNKEKLIEDLFNDTHNLIMKYAELGMGPQDIAYTFLSVSYNVVHIFGPKNIDKEDLFVGMAMECAKSMFKGDDKNE